MQLIYGNTTSCWTVYIKRGDEFIDEPKKLLSIILYAPEADVVESLVVDDKSLIGVLNQLGKRLLLTLKCAKDYEYEDVQLYTGVSV